MNKKIETPKANGLALIPFLVFIGIYLGAGIVLNSQGVDMAFYQFPAPVAIVVGVIVAFAMFPGKLGAGTESLGVVIPETTPTTRTAYSVGRVLETDDAGDANYDQLVTSFVGSVVTFDAAATIAYLDLVEGDYVVIDSDEAAEVNRVVDPLTSATTITMEKDLLASHATNITMYKLVQIEVELI